MLALFFQSLLLRRLFHLQGDTYKYVSLRPCLFELESDQDPAGKRYPWRPILFHDVVWEPPSAFSAFQDTLPTGLSSDPMPAGFHVDNDML